MIARLPALLLFLALSAPAFAQAVPSPLQKDDPFGQEVTLPDKTIIFLRSRGKWDSAYDALVDTYASLNQYMDKQKLKANGPALTIFTDTNDTGFQFLAALPIAAPPADPPKGDIAIGKAPSGRALKFTHRGTYDSMDITYEAITNYLDEKRLDAKDMFIEEYAGGPLKHNDDKLVVYVYVPIK